MANPLKLLKLKATGFQVIQEVPVDAPPARVWTAVLDFPGWFVFGGDAAPPRRMTVEPRVGGHWIEHLPDGGAMLNTTITHIEPNKLLRMSGPMGLTHLPVNNVFIFELQPKGAGQTTLLRFCQRTFGFVTTDQKKKYQHGWSQLLPQIKALAERRDQQTVRKTGKKNGRRNQSRTGLGGRANGRRA